MKKNIIIIVSLLAIAACLAYMWKKKCGVFAKKSATTPTVAASVAPTAPTAPKRKSTAKAVDKE